jgi:hypothetical protein
MKIRTNAKRLCLLAALIALTAAAAFAQTEADFDVTVANNAVKITVYRGSATTVNIPARIRNLPVTAIEDAFSYNVNITSVVIPAGVTTIGELTFLGCTKLTSVTIPASVTSIGDQAFSGCTSLTSIAIPAGVTSIGRRAFRNCTSLTSVTFSGTLAQGSFHAEAFDGIGDIRDKFYATNATVGNYGRSTRPNGTCTVWTRQ